MNLHLRPGKPEDAEACGVICYKAFNTISAQHNFPADFPTPDPAIGLLSMLLSRPDVYSVVAEVDDKPAGSNFLWQNGLVAGVGPITVDPTVQNSTIGRQLMDEVLRYAEEKNLASVRLVQAAFHNRSLALYTKLGFDTREPLSAINGPALNFTMSSYAVRPMTEGDIEACNNLCRKIHGHDRGAELADAIVQGTGNVVEHEGRISGYATSIGFLGHAVGESNDELKALIGAAPEFFGPGFLLPTRNSELMRWCLGNGLRVVQPMTLMSKGLYNEPRGAFLPSVLF